jgi:hypothetical protein
LGEDFGMHAAQLVPTEVMVQREKGFNAATRDWEFFELDEQTSARELAAVAQNGSVKRFELVPNRTRCFEFPHRLDPKWAVAMGRFQADWKSTFTVNSPEPLAVGLT